jgi:C-terminal processing protease CtpA/Prc
MVSSGVWITIRSFYLSREETIFYTVMLSQLKELVKEDWILFDLRNNRGGDPFGQGLLFAIYGEMIILNI